jgi:hypothetical protein
MAEEKKTIEIKLDDDINHHFSVPLKEENYEYLRKCFILLKKYGICGYMRNLTMENIKCVNIFNLKDEVYGKIVDFKCNKKVAMENKQIADNISCNCLEIKNIASKYIIFYFLLLENIRRHIDKISDERKNHILQVLNDSDYKELIYYDCKGDYSSVICSSEGEIEIIQKLCEDEKKNCWYIPYQSDICKYITFCNKNNPVHIRRGHYIYYIIKICQRFKDIIEKKKILSILENGLIYYS